jgi:hypothetical protein
MEAKHADIFIFLVRYNAIYYDFGCFRAVASAKAEAFAFQARHRFSNVKQHHQLRIYHISVGHASRA